MSLKIRMRQQGKKGQISYRIVVTDAKNPRDGKYVECVGTYNPHAKENDVIVKEDRLLHWIGVGAQLTEKVKSLVARSTPEAYKSVFTAKGAAK